MKSESLSLDSVVQLLKSAQSDLHSAENSWLTALKQDVGLPGTDEAEALEELLHEATHEIGSNLGFYVNDIETMIIKIRIRAKFGQYSNDQFKQIVRNGWSLDLVRKLHNALPSISLDDHSSALHSICSQLSSLPKLAHSRFRS